MNTNTTSLNKVISEYRLPRYREIPNVGLYLEQSAKYINMHLAPLGYPELTTSMIGNYVKQKVISGPYKKQYGAEHIACLIVLVIMKSVLTIEDARMILDEKRSQYTIEEGYNILCDIFEAQLKETFRDTNRAKTGAMRKKENDSPAEGIVHNVISAAVHKIYLDMRISSLRQAVLAREADAERLAANAKKKEKEEKKNKKNPEEDDSCHSTKEGDQYASVVNESANN